MSKVLVPISIGELFDKITILEIKQEKIKDPKKLLNVNNELKLLLKVSETIDFSVVESLVKELKEINSSLWNIENQKRRFERKKLFKNEFIELSRMVYILNDKRANVKKEINVITNSDIVEEKNYE